MAAIVALGLSGCWLQPRFDAGRSNANMGEQELTAATVSGLTELWSTEIVTSEVPAAGSVTAPLALGEDIYAVQTAALGSGLATAVDAATGDRRWTTPLGIEPVSAGFPVNEGDPLHHQGQLLVPWGGYRSGGQVTIDPATGAVVGRTGGQLGSSAPSDLAAGGDRVLHREVALFPQPPTLVMAIRGFPFTPFLQRPASDAGAGSSFAVVGDSVAWGDGTSATGYHPDCPRINRDLCSASWTTDLGAAPGDPTAVGDRAVVYADASGTVSLLDMATGAIAWQAELGAAPVGQPTVAGDTILVATGDGRLVALSAAGCGVATCAPRWEAAVGATPAAEVTVGGDVAYVGTTAGDVSGFALAGCGAAACEPLVTVSAGSGVTGGPIVHDGRLLVGTDDGRLVAFGLPG